MEKTVQLYEGKAKKVLPQPTKIFASFPTRTTPLPLTARKRALFSARESSTTV